MITELQQRLSEFVDRDAEIDRFRAMLDGAGKSVMCVVGPGGIGKSSLMARMLHEISNRSLAKAEIIYTDDNLPEFMAIMRRCRDEIGAAWFRPFTDLIEYFTRPGYTLHVELHGNVSVAENMVVSGDARIDTIAGVVIKDSMITFPRSDLDVSEAERRATLTRSFIDCLAVAARNHARIVIVIDAAEKMSDGASRWLWNTLIAGIAERELQNVHFVVFGRSAPVLDRYKMNLVDLSELKELTVPDIVLYLERRGITAEHRQPLAGMVFVASKGNPFEIANFVDAYLRLQERQTAGAR